METIYQHTSFDENGKRSDYYRTEEKITHDEYKRRFGHGIALKNNQKRITVVKEEFTKEQVEKLIASGTHQLKYKN